MPFQRILPLSEKQIIIRDLRKYIKDVIPN